MKEGLDPAINVSGRLFRLDDEAQSLDAVGSPYVAVDDVAELLLRAQHVVARLVQDLSRQFQQHVGTDLLQPALQVHLHAVRRVHFVLGAVQEIAT